MRTGPFVSFCGFVCCCCLLLLTGEKRREEKGQGYGKREKAGGGTRQDRTERNKTHSPQQIIQLARHATRARWDVFARHARHFDGGAAAYDVDEAVVEEVEIVHRGEGLRGVFGGGGEVRLRVRGGDDGEVWEFVREGWIRWGFEMGGGVE